MPTWITGTTPTVKFDEGTGTNCGTSNTALTGPMAGPIQPTSGMMQFKAADGDSVCLNLSGTGSPTAGGSFVYVLQ
jgi:hypothetical protein